jgi:sortase A
VVEGDDWEQLKKGVGHHVNSANPGERGNCVLSGHNDVFGEVFRRLEDLELDDEVIVYTGVQPYRYVVKAKRIVEPTDVSVMYPTTKPVLTLITCHPYMVDTHRLVVVAELSE